jgi:hypothetical protein
VIIDCLADGNKLADSKTPQYLKMPDYSNKEVLAAQIQRAMLDGGGSFHLS